MLTFTNYETQRWSPFCNLILAETENSMCKKVLNILPKIVKSVQTIERLKRAFICYSVPEITAFWNEVGSGCKKPNPFKKL